ncbi:MAG TPA: amino acid adenylation domain-containing protein, partial [Pseudonocardiaceae bacterium]|nr:amino acid adenylation domain-containing protein [Pseudonocardiaceae bacterium]
MTERRQQGIALVEAGDVVARRVRSTSTTLRRVRHTWLAGLAAAEPVQPISGLFGRRGGAGTHGWLPVQLDPVSSRRLAEWSGRTPVRALALLVAAGGIVTGRYAGRDDLLVRTPDVGAPVAPAVPVWLDAVPDETVAALLDRAVRTIGDALTAASAMPPQAGAETLDRQGGAVVVAVDPYQQPPEDAELTCVATISDAGFEVRLRFNRDAVGESVARGFAGHLGMVLRTFGCAPETPVADVDILSAEERTRILGALSNAEPVLTPQALLPDRVREFAATVPDRTAVRYRARSLTYAELDRAARAVADRLADLGVTAGDRVALLLDRGDLPVVAVLGCFALGAVYVPVDTRHPDDRVRFMLADCTARAMITEPALKERIPADFTGPVLVIADPHELAAQAASERVGPKADAPAYAIYTSGTTGTPKAVLVSHGAFAATCASYPDCYRSPAQPPVCLQLGSFAFDVFNGDLGRSLYAGGTLVVCPDEVRAEIDGIVDLVAEHHVTVMESTPALVNPLSEALARSPEALAHLDVLVSSADAWRGQDYLAVRKLLAEHVRLYNVYGATEAAIDQTYYPPGEHGGTDLPYVPIGRPLRHVSVYVVDHRMRLQPAGVPGELCVGGAGVAIGYLGRGELTAERFRPDPFGRGDRLYRTGDLVRFRSDGDLEFLGRVDDQVKIRGFRVELGEVESVLREHPGIREVVADARDDGAGTKRLVAYLVPVGDLPSATELREFCGRFLPVYLVPSVFVGVVGLPLSGNGKVVRGLLPDPGVGRV